ncbi:MAG TPA: hydrogenase maturation nickel metallochaperone HypA [Acidobacteriaceae bacterium]|nr:hydrogenase maturation nickel metallochaperone HypA [Acidobacteriaceae bacterium]
MHELSIAAEIVDCVTESLAAYPNARVLEVRLKIGALAAIVEESLQFCYSLATEGTPLAGSKLVVLNVPITVDCTTCRREVALDSLQSFRCPGCGQPAGDVRRGRELEVEAIEIEEAEEAPAP